MSAAAELYKALKHACPAPGGGKGFHQKSFGVARAGADAGLDVATVFRDLREIADLGDRDVPDSEISATIDNAYGLVTKKRSPPVRPAIPGGLTFRHIVERGERFAFSDIRRDSPVPIPKDPVQQGRLLLRSLYKPSELIFIGERFQSGRGCIRSVSQYLAHDPTYAPHIIPNPLTGSPAPCKGSSNKKTFRGDNCVASYRFALIEFDGLSIDEQVHFYAGVDLPVAAIIGSGGKSLHAWLLVDVSSADAWAANVAPLYPSYFGPLGVDSACSNPSRLSRMPGHYRADTERYQELLFLDPEARGPRFYLTRCEASHE